MILIVKSPFALPAAGFALVALLSACGQPGPLYMPKPPSPRAVLVPVPVAVPDNTASAPAPAAGVTTPVARSNANSTQAPQTPSPATQQ